MLKTLLHKKYLLYGGSIIATRALEYVVLFFAAHYLPKAQYGELEYYKKLIEVVSVAFAFGFPAFIVSYTKSKESKQYFYFLGSCLVIAIAAICALFFSLFNALFLIVPFVFYALFFNGGITPSYLLVKEGSDYAAFYKIGVSVLFYSAVFCAIYFYDVTAYAYVVASYVLFPLALLHMVLELQKQALVLKKIKRYWKLFKKLIISSLTLVVSNFANLMFLYTDIFILNSFSQTPKLEIADYSFALNIANVLILIPMTLVQVDIEKLKASSLYTRILNKKIIVAVSLASLTLVALFYVMTHYMFEDYKGVMSLFILILVAKIVQALSPLYGTMLIIHKKFKENLLINMVALVLNILLSYTMYNRYGIHGVAMASIISLAIRQVMLIYTYKKTIKKS